MGIKTVYEPGDTIYYPVITDCKGSPMIVKDYYLNRGKKGYWAQYLTEELLDCLVQDMHKNIDQHYDNLVVITGAEGSGKSNLAYWVAKKFDPDFNVEDGYIYDIGPFLNKLDSDDIKGRVYWMDEATNIASNRDWMKDANKSLIQLLEMLRSKGMTLIMCIPVLDRLDVYIRESRLRYHLITAHRAWTIDDEAKRGYFELKSKDSRFKTVCWGTFPAIPSDISAIYEQLKAKAQRDKIHEIREKFEENEGGGSRLRKSAQYNRQLAWLLIKQGGMSYQDIEEQTGIPAGDLRRWIHEMKEEGEP